MIKTLTLNKGQGPTEKPLKEVEEAQKHPRNF